MAVKNLLMSMALLAALAVACGASRDPSTEGSDPRSGEEIFNAQCTLCHGRDGKLGINGAKDLSVSQLSRPDMIAIVTRGKGAMLPYQNVLSTEEIERVVDHVRSLTAPKSE